MKKYNKTPKLILMFFLEFILLVLMHNTAFAISSDAEKVVTPGTLKEWDDGASVEKKASGKAETYKVDVTADTTGLEEDYYSVYLYDYTKRNIKSYDGIRFQFSNDNDIDLKINLTLTVNSKKSVTMSEGSFAILESAQEEKTEVLATTYGTLSIPAHFDGMVYVPFSQLFNEDGENISLSSIQSYGITTVISKDQKVSYSIGNIAFLRGSIAAMKDSCYLITLSGKEDIVLPNIGSTQESYQAKIMDLEGNEVDAEPLFFMEDRIEGVTVSEDGTLEIQSSCVASEIIIYAKTSQSINAGKLKISFEHVSADVAAVGVPKVEDVPKITSTVYTKLQSSVVWSRILLAVVAIVILSLFVTWFTKAKENYQNIYKKLHKIFEEEEE